MSERVTDALWLYFRAALHVFFREIELQGRENVPEDGPLLLVSNHLNAFVDPLLIQLGMKRRITITAKGPLTRQPLVGTLMRLTRVIAFHRLQDRGTETGPDRLKEHLDECGRRLEEGAAIVLFPEAKSHDDPGLRPFRHGASRIAFDHVLKHGMASRLRLVPVGLSFEAKEHARSRALVRFGEPIDAASWVAEHPGASPARLTAELKRRIRKLVVEHDSRREELLTRWAARLVLASEERRPWGASTLSTSRHIRDGLRRDTVGGRALARSILAHRQRLQRLGLGPESLHGPADLSAFARFLFKESLVLGPLAPLATWGALQNLPPTLLTCAVTHRISRLRDMWASNAVFSSFLAYPPWYAAQTAASLALLPPPLGLLRALAVPAAGWLALGWWDRLNDDRLVWRACMTFLRSPGLKGELLAESEALALALRALLPPEDERGA